MKILYIWIEQPSFLYKNIFAYVRGDLFIKKLIN